VSIDFDYLPPPPDTWDLATNQRHCARRYLYLLGLEVDGGAAAPEPEREESTTPARDLQFLCDCMERLEVDGEALEFVALARDLLEALDDAQSGDPSISALAGAGDAWSAATTAWDRWEKAAASSLRRRAAREGE
jgi:hypothetical protein